MGITWTSSESAAAALERSITAVFRGREAPAWELALPQSGPVRGVAMMVHGGGWTWVGPGTLRGCDMHVERWLQRGWATVNVDYRAGGQSLPDVLAFHDAIRGWAGMDTPMGILGVSAGGHLALMTAAQRNVDWVVGVGAPTHLASLGGTEGANTVRAMAEQSFGSSAAALQAMSPTHHADAIRGQVLLAASAADDVVPPAQVPAFLTARPHDTVGMILEPGEQEFIHAGVSSSALAKFTSAEEAMLARAYPQRPSA